MKNIYELLKKHFSQEATAEEEKLVSEFKKNHMQEYQVLKQLWYSNANIKVTNFDSNAAWTKVLEQANEQRTRRIPLYTKIQRVAAIALILIASALTIYVINKNISSKELTIITSQVINRNEIVLSDGSKIWLNKNSQLCYPENFNGKTRNVSLSGEAFFEITRNPEKPFIIETNHSEVKVLGTSFNINTDSLQTAISVTTGKVNVKSAYSQSSVNLLPNDMATVSNNALQKSQITNPNYLSWKTGVFNFKDTPLHDVVRDLNSFYNKPIILKYQLTTCSFSASFDNANLADIIEILQLSCNLTIQENTNFYEIN